MHHQDSSVKTPVTRRSATKISSVDLLHQGTKGQDIPPGHSTERMQKATVDASTGKTIYTRARDTPQGRIGETEMAAAGIHLLPESPHKKPHPTSLQNSTSPRCPKSPRRSPPHLLLPHSPPASCNPPAKCSAPPRAQLPSRPSL